MIKRLIYFFKRNIFNISFLKFAIVGFLGTITNLFIFFIFVDVLKLPERMQAPLPERVFIFFIFVDVLKLWINVIAVIVFLLAGIQNYILHHKWTFRETTCGENLSFYGWIKFNLTTLVGLGINLIVLDIVLYFFTVPYKVIAQFCGVGSGTILNYLGSKYFVFNKDKFGNKEKESVKKL